MSEPFEMADERWRHRMPTADALGHRTRSSDSSLYDEVCVLCGATDRDHDLDRPCGAAVSDEQAGTVTRLSVPVSMLAADAPGQGFGGLSLPDAMDASRATAGKPGRKESLTYAEEGALARLRAAAPDGNIAISPFGSIGQEGSHVVDLLVRDAVGVVRTVAQDVPIDTARYLVALWRADRLLSAPEAPPDSVVQL